MSDFPPPAQTVTNTHVGSTSMVYGPSVRSILTSSVGLAPVATTWVSGLAVYMPFVFRHSYVVRRVWWVNGSTISSTSVDMGIYTEDGTRLYSTTPTAMAGISLPQYVAVATPFTLLPGRYYLAWTCNNTTSRAFALAVATDVGERIGLLTQSSVATLPDPATFAAYAGQGMPYCGVTRTATGFA